MTEEVPRLSPSIAQKGLEESTLAMWAAHRLLAGGRREASDSQTEGRMWHSALLESAHDVVEVHFDSFRTNAAKEEKARILEAGKIPVLTAKLEAMRERADTITEQLYRKGWDLNAPKARHEVRLEWEENSELGEVLCSGYADSIEGLVVRDIKTSKVAVSHDLASRLIANSYSLLQGAAYPSAVAEMLEVDRSEIKMEFWFVQTQMPFEVTCFEFAGDFQQLADMRWQRAVEMWARCLAAGKDRAAWEPPFHGPSRLTAPGWMLNQELELEAMAS